MITIAYSKIDELMKMPKFIELLEDNGEITLDILKMALQLQRRSKNRSAPLPCYPRCMIRDCSFQTAVQTIREDSTPDTTLGIYRLTDPVLAQPC